MATTQKELGEIGEDMAEKHLLKLGYTILERNWRHHHLEVDLIARDKDELVIIEVKTRSGVQFGHPSEAITRQKMNHLINAADAYIKINNSSLDTRFDVITVVMNRGTYRLEHFEDAFYPGLN
ncbi:MAG: YraN family protein [Mangrovibacterium sp.]